MSAESRASELLTILAGDPGLRARLSEASRDERVAIIAELGYADVSAADVTAAAAALAPQVGEDSSIDDEDLAGVTGGGGIELNSYGAFIVE